MKLRSRPELAFVLAPRQNLFFVELVEAIRAEAVALGVHASLHVGNFPAPRSDLVYVLVPPHEYFTLMHGRFGPSPEVLKRTICICAEQPNTPFFENNFDFAPRAGAVFDINRFSVRRFAQRGIAAQHLQLGWTSSWDHFSEANPRDIDVLFMGSITDWRARALGSYARTFSRYRVELVVSDNARPNWAPSESFRIDQAKWDLLGRAKVLINIHQEANPYFEWLRIVQAISAGTVVVSEHSIDFAPLSPGQDLMMGDVKSLNLLTEMLLEDEDRRERMRHAAYTKLREQVPMSSAVEGLAAAASELAQREPTPDGRHIFFTQAQPDPERLPVVSDPIQPTSRFDGKQDTAWIRRGLKDLRLEMLELRRTQARIELEAARGQRLPQLELVDATCSYRPAVPRVSVLTALYNHASVVPEALTSAALSRDCAFELIVVDDGSTDDSSAAVLEWMAEHQDTPTLLLRHPVNRGLAHARNGALSIARGEFCFVLDADNTVYPHCLSRLSSALDADPTAAFAYGSLEAFSGNECVGLMNFLPWQPERLRAGNYIDAMAMMRTSIIRSELGGYPADHRLHGWEDFALWCAVAEAGYHAIRVPEILARYRVARHSMLSLTNISETDAFSVVIEANPTLMMGVQAPD